MHTLPGKRKAQNIFSHIKRTHMRTSAFNVDGLYISVSYCSVRPSCIRLWKTVCKLAAKRAC